MVTARPAERTTSYTYDGDGRRLSRTGPDSATVWYWWDSLGAPGELAVETDPDAAHEPVRTYLHGHAPLGVDTGDEPVLWHRDGLGSITGVTTSTGERELTRTYEAFGTPQASLSTGTVDVTLGYTGGYDDPGGYLHLQARQYQPGIGRFHAPDPWQRPTDQPWTSRYAYTDNQPHTYVDPTGLFTLPDVVANLNVRQTLTTMAVPAIGGVASTVIHGVTAEERSWRSYLAAFVSGATVTSVAARTARFAVTLARLVPTGFAASVLDDLIAGRPFDLCAAGRSAILTPAGSGVAGISHRGLIRLLPPRPPWHATEAIAAGHPIQGEVVGAPLGFAEPRVDEGLAGLTGGLCGGK